jgi:hypothetical protein
MTETPDPPAIQDTPSSVESGAAESTTMQRRSVWRRLNRTNRIAALILGGIGAVLVAALLFGAGVLVGSESGDSEGHHHESRTFHDDGGGSESEGDDQGDHQDAGGSEREGDQQDGGESERDRSGGEPAQQQPRSDVPRSPTPTTPRP